MTRASVVVVATLALGASGAHAQTPEQFYAGRNVDFLIGSAAGGGYGVYATLLSRHIGRHIPGQPRVVARYMEGAGSLTAANTLYASSPKDGATFGAVFTGAIVEPLIGDRAKARYDSRRFGLIGSANREVEVCFARKEAGFRGWGDALSKTLIVGGAGWTSSIRQYPAVLNKILGTKFEIVAGYPGSKEAVAAVEKGETQGICGIQWSSFAPGNGKWVENGDVTVFGQIAGPTGDALQNARGVPNIWSIVQDDAKKRALELVFDQSEFGRPYVAPPGVPPDRLEALRRAFDATMKDPAYLAEATQIGLPIDPMNGEDFQATVDKLYKVPDAEVAVARAALE